MIGWVYDLLGRRAERGELGTLRQGLVADLEGQILEFGAGTGANLPHYRRAAKVVALEPDPRMGGRLPAKRRQARVPVEVVAGSVEALPFADASFDVAVSTFVLCSVHDPERALAEVRRVLRPRGRLVLLEHVRGPGRLGRWQERFTPLHRKLAGNCHLSRNTAESIARAGFDVSALRAARIPGSHPLVRSGIQGAAIRISS